MPRIFKAYNGPAPGASPTPKVNTGTALRTMLQLQPTLDVAVVSWGVEFDGSAANTPIQVELVETSAAATVTAFAAGDIVKLTEPYVGANPPFTLGTAASGFTASSEGTPGVSRLLDYRMIAPTNEFAYQWALDLEPVVQSGKFLRVRVLAPNTVSMICNVETKPVG